MPEIVYIVLKNADFTEGRGPMFFHKVFKTRQIAHDYIMQQEGIYGTPQRQSTGLENNYNGYQIISAELQTELLTASEKNDIEKKILNLTEAIEILKNKLR
jgi:hypothetical protein